MYMTIFNFFKKILKHIIVILINFSVRSKSKNVKIYIFYYCRITIAAGAFKSSVFFGKFETHIISFRRYYIFVGIFHIFVLIAASEDIIINNI